MKRLFPLAALATLLAAVLVTVLAAAPSAQTTAVPRTTADPRADPSAPLDRTSDQLRPDPTGIRAGTVSDNQTRDARVIENPTIGTTPQGQMTGQTQTGRTAARPMDGMGQDMAAPDFARLDRDLRGLGTDPNTARYSQERDAIRRDYDALGTTATMDARMGVARRYEDLNASVGASRMSRAARADYFRMGDDQIRMYDRDIEAARMGFSNATGDMRAERAVEIIRLRRQRDQYRNDVFEVRGAGASGFDAARRSAAQNLSRYDTDFRTARRESMMRGSMGAQPMNDSMGNGSMGTQPARPAPRN